MYLGNICIFMNTVLDILDEFLRYNKTDYSTSILIASSESIDENQNQIPRYNRKLAKILSKTDEKRKRYVQSPPSSYNEDNIRKNIRKSRKNYTG